MALNKIRAKSMCIYYDKISKGWGLVPKGGEYKDNFKQGGGGNYLLSPPEMKPFIPPTCALLPPKLFIFQLYNSLLPCFGLLRR